MSLPPCDVNLCVFFLNKHHNTTKNHGNQVRKNENTFAVRANKSWLLSWELRVVLGDQRLLSHLDNQGTRHPVAVTWARRSPGASGSPSSRDSALGLQRPLLSGAVPSRAGRPAQASSPDPAALRQASLLENVGGRTLGVTTMSDGGAEKEGLSRGQYSHFHNGIPSRRPKLRALMTM